MEPDPGWVGAIRATIPELPRARRDRYVDGFGLKPEVARVLVADRGATMYFEGAVALGADAGAAANWVTQDVAALRNAGGDDGALTPQHVADVVRLIAAGYVSNAGAKQALEAAFTSGETLESAVDRLGLRQVSDTGALGTLADAVLAEHPDVVQKFRDGKEGVIGFLVGQLMQKAAGAANPKVAQDLLRERLQG
jgi:aspartyl-tRNA(Asn)/glutamyl-tRNA(Gln) amidotransferase subunit B